jgi:hypothetical protein
MPLYAAGGFRFMGRPIAVDVAPWTVGLAIAQIMLLGLAVSRAVMRRRHFEALLCGAGLTTALVALWSVARIPGIIGDYHVFWISIVGALNCAALAGTASDRLVQRLIDCIPLGLIALAYPLFAVAALIRPAQTLLGMRQATNRGAQTNEIKASADAIVKDIIRGNISRALVRGGPQALGRAGGGDLGVVQKEMSHRR